MSCPTPVTLCKRAADAARFNFDFSRYREPRAGQAILTAAVASTPSGLTVGTPAVSGAYVQAQISGGAAGTTYLLTCTITTSGGATRTMQGYLEVE